MKFNGFYDDIEAMITDPMFINDLETRIDMLKDFRSEIKAAPMPQWMLDNLENMHDDFPEGTAVRCRSSTNNEDLPGFSGAGLYTSKTQHLDEGHISKSIKQVYASMWNFRAFDERDFYRVDHYIAAMGILCHPNFQEEKSNGVGVSIDPIYNTDNTFYLNTQVGEFLITNPDANSIPEEILLSEDPNEGYVVLRRSNLIPDDELVMDESYLELMRDYLKVIHDEFAVLYNVVGAEGFGMDIEYKVTAEDQLVVKQARPWVSFWADIKATFDLAPVEFINPQSSANLGASELVSVDIANKGLKDMTDFEILLLLEGAVVETLAISDTISPQSSKEFEFTIPQDFSAIGDYNLSAIVSHPSDGYHVNDTLDVVLSKVHLLEGGITILDAIPKCGEEIEVHAQVINYGQETFIDTEIEVVVNSVTVDVVNYSFNIPYLAEVDIFIIVDENLQLNDNEITLNLISVNDQNDAVNSNNTSNINVGLDSNYDYVTVVIEPDDYPEEISWSISDVFNNELLDSGFLVEDDELVASEVCLNANSCFTLTIYDSFGDGMCCAFGMGYFYVLSSSGDTLSYNNGEFESNVEVLFCPNGEGCAFTANIETTVTTDEFTADGVITIDTQSGIGPFEYSIDGGETFYTASTFPNLPAGEYMIVVTDATGSCTYEETVEVEVDIMDSLEDIVIGNIKLFPNPTIETVTIALGENFDILGEVEIVILDALGRMVHTDSISKSNGESSAVISLKDYRAGTYFAKCFNKEFEKYFKVIKID